MITLSTQQETRASTLHRGALAADALVRGELPEYWEWWDASGVDVVSILRVAS
ncbi:MAG: hypothetical protein ACRDIC_20485 [bacterium]